MLPKDQEKHTGVYAVFLVGLCGLLSGAYLRPGMLFQPVVFDIFYWTLLSFLLLQYINTQKAAWLLWFGVATGLGLLNKYTIFIQLFALLPGMLLYKAPRRIFADKNLYLAAGLALLIFLPNIIWQINHQFPVFRHLSGLASSQFANVTLTGFFMDQIMFHTPALPIWIAGLFFLLSHQRFASWRIFGFMYLTTLAVLLFF